jgi:hypothetical protein
MLGYVVTTIQSASQQLITLASRMVDQERKLYIVADLKTPLDFSLEKSLVLTVAMQETLEWQLTKVLPYNIYSRKMIGYLEAIKEGCSWLVETDDDNLPLESFYEKPLTECFTRQISGESEKWINPYAYFTDQKIWPRGYPIELLIASWAKSTPKTEDSLIKITNVALYQGLANGEPDVDAIYRLVISDDSKMEFKNLAPIALPSYSYAPFNSQATCWSQEIYPLLYLPSTCTFRMTDIWRSFIAQRLMRETDFELVFTSPTVFQDRNPHDFLRDFSDEIPGYLGNSKLVELLDNTKVEGGVENFGADLKTLYSALVSHGYLESEEINYLDAWLTDLRHL